MGSHFLRDRWNSASVPVAEIQGRSCPDRQQVESRSQGHRHPAWHRRLYRLAGPASGLKRIPPTPSAQACRYWL